MRKSKMRKYILWLLLFLAAGLIFCFSSQNAENSSKLSWDVVGQVAEHSPMAQDFSQNAEMTKPSPKWDGIHWFVRKTAHFTMFCALGFLLMCLMRSYQKYRFRHILAVLLIGGLYAISDEFHQYFVPGREARLLDVLIDTAGVACGIALSFAVCWLHERRMRKCGKMTETNNEKII